MQLECLVQISHFIGDFQNISLNNKKMNIKSICKLMSFVAEQRPLSNLLLLHVWDGLLLNPPNYTILLCLIISALAGIKTEAHFPVFCTTLLFRVLILQSEAAPTQARESLWGQRQGNLGWGPQLVLSLLSLCYTLEALHHSQLWG